MKNLSVIFLLVFLLIHVSCNQEKIIWPLNNSPSDLIVVEGILTNEKIRHSIKLSKPYLKQNEMPEPISGATVYIITNDSVPEIINTNEFPQGSGHYLTNSIRAVSGKIYTLVIKYNFKEYRASASQPPIEALDNPLSYKPVSDATYTLNFVPSGNEPNYIKYFLDWRLTDYCINQDSCQALQIFYDLKNIDINEQFKPDQEVVIFPKGTTVIRKKYSVSDEYRAYLRGMLSETAWRGGYFDVYQANPPTNLSDGAIGFFTVSTVLSDITVIQ